VVLVREVEQLAGNVELLEGVERAQPLGLADSIVLGPADDQYRRLPATDEVYRCLLLIAHRITPGRAKKLPLGESKLVGVEIGHAFVERAIVVDQAAEPVGPVAGDPVDHVATIGRPKRPDAVAVHPGISHQGPRQALLEVLQRFAAPVATNRVRKCLRLLKIMRELRLHFSVKGGVIACPQRHRCGDCQHRATAELKV
jgi:hypothetical protein